MSAIKDFLQGKPLRHPLHPALVHFPIGLFVFSLALDLASYLFPEAGWMGDAARAALGLGVLMGLLAALPGWADWSDIRQDHPLKRRANLHLALNLGVVGLNLVNYLLRRAVWPDAVPTPVLPLLLSLAGVGVISYSGFLGGTLVYDGGIGPGRHRREAPLPKKTIRVSLHDARQGVIPVIPLDDLREGETIRVDCEGNVMAILRLGGQAYAFQEFCTHRYGPLSEGCIEGYEVECPWHRSRFDVRTGKVTQGPAKVDLRTYEVVVERGMVGLRGSVSPVGGFLGQPDEKASGAADVAETV